jgi:hypothetical protein
LTFDVDAASSRPHVSANFSHELFLHRQHRRAPRELRGDMLTAVRGKGVRHRLGPLAVWVAALLGAAAHADGDDLAVVPFEQLVQREVVSG